MDTRDSRLSERDQAEIERSAEEARKIVSRASIAIKLTATGIHPVILPLPWNMRFICWATFEARLCWTLAAGLAKT